MKGFRLGNDKGSGRVIRHRGPAHMVLCAPTGTGKATDVIIPMVLEAEPGERSYVFIDPKGQLAAQIAPYLARMGYRIKILNPFQILPEAIGPKALRFRGVEDRVDFDAKLNPMDTLDPYSEAFGADTDNIIDGVVLFENSRDRHWQESAHEAISGVTMHLKSSFLPHMQDMVEMRRLIAGPSADLRAFCREALASGDPFTRDRLARYAEEEPKNANELESILSTAKTATKFISNGAIARNLKGDGWRFRDIRKESTAVFLVLPTRHLKSCSKWFGVAIETTLHDLLIEPEEGDLPVLLVADEFSQLGRMVSIENAMGLGRGYNLQLFIIVQDLTRLREHYPNSWETFFKVDPIVKTIFRSQ
jgi:type IV secretion system protein VirD4